MVPSDLKKPIAGSAEIIGQTINSTKFNDLDYLSKVYPQGKTYLTGGEIVQSSLDVSHFNNNRIVRFQPVEIQKHDGLFSGLVDFFYNISRYLQPSDAKAIIDEDSSETLSIKQKIEAMFEMICQESIINDKLEIINLCKDKNWSSLLTYNHHIINTLIDDHEDSDDYDLKFRLALLSKMYTLLTLSIPENSSNTSRLCVGDSGTPIYLEQEEKELIAGVLSTGQPPKTPEFQDDIFKRIKQALFYGNQLAKSLLYLVSPRVVCINHSNADYLYPHLPWIIETKARIFQNKENQ